MITQESNRLIIKDGFGTVWIEPWGKNSVRVRMTADRKMDSNDWALENEEGESLARNFAHSCSLRIPLALQVSERNLVVSDSERTIPSPR